MSVYTYTCRPMRVLNFPSFILVVLFIGRMLMKTWMMPASFPKLDGLVLVFCSQRFQVGVCA